MFRSLRTALVLCLPFVVGSLPYRRALADAELPSRLVVRFDESARDLDQAAIHAALTHELGFAPDRDGSNHAATLTIAVTGDDELSLSYRPEPNTLARRVALTEGSDLPELVAHLAGNLVRDQAAAILDELRPAPTSPKGTESPPRAPREGEDDAALSPAERWWLSLLVGGSVVQRSVELTVQPSRRWGAVELSLPVRAAYWNTNILAGEAADGTSGLSGNFDIYQLTLPLGLEYRVIEYEHAYLQLGGYGGVRFAFLPSAEKNVLSGSGARVALGLQTTLGLRLGERSGLLLRGTWDILPGPRMVVWSGDTRYELSGVPIGAHLGWQTGW